MAGATGVSMTPKITAMFESRGEAEAARGRLIAAGVDPAGIAVAEQIQEALRDGLFDRLTEHLAPSRVRTGDAYLLTAEVSAGQLDAATRAIDLTASGQDPPVSSPGSARIEDRTYEFVETAEEVAIEKQLVVREEIVLAKEAHEHVEDVVDTVRRTEVEIEQIEPGEPDQSGRKR